MKAREQAAKVVELLSEARGISILKTTPEDARVINQHVWETSLWLPAQTVRALTKHLISMARGEPSGSIKDILVEVRRHILQDPNDDLRAEEIFQLMHPGRL